jgi:hypothetical protein
MTTMANRTAPSVLPGRSDAAALTHTTELAEKVLEQLMKGRTLSDVCRDDGMPAAQTVRRWVFDDPEGFAARYLRARQIGAVAMAHQAYEIAADALDAWTRQQGKRGGAAAARDRELVGRSLLRIGARCWLLAKLLPGICGDQAPPASMGKTGEGK